MKKDYEDIFLYDCKHGQHETVQNMLNLGVNIEIKNKWDETGLITASSNGHTKCVQTLIKNGANLEFPTTIGWTALMHAAYHNHEDIVRNLIENGAKTDLIDSKRNTPYNLTRSKKIKYFLENKNQLTAKREQKDIKDFINDKRKETSAVKNKQRL